MTVFVLDASLALSWCIPDEYTPETNKILRRLQDDDSAVIPALWIWEIGNVLMLAERRKRLDPAQRQEQIAMLQSLDLEIDELSTRQAWSATARLAETYKLTLYDAAYLELALRRGLPLASLDRNLRAAAELAGVGYLPEAAVLS
jgi:predicted nucleic acid-binding protein